MTQGEKREGGGWKASIEAVVLSVAICVEASGEMGGGEAPMAVYVLLMASWEEDCSCERRFGETLRGLDGQDGSGSRRKSGW